MQFNIGYHYFVNISGYYCNDKHNVYILRNFD